MCPFHYITLFSVHQIWEDGKDYRHTPEYSDIYKLRKETIERVFADAKEKHSMRYTQYRGLAKVKAEATLRFACMNLKKLAKWKRIKGLLRSFIRGFIQILAQVIITTRPTGGLL